MGLRSRWVGYFSRNWSARVMAMSVAPDWAARRVKL